MMDQPMGNVIKLEYRSVGARLQGDVLRVHIRTHMDTVTHHDLPNNHYVKRNPALQFMALNGFKPSDFDERGVLEPDMTLVPLAPMPPESWGLARAALQGGKEALENADWFEGAKVDDSDDGGQPPGGGSPDPGTGNRGGVDEPSESEPETGVSIEQSPADADTGVEVVVSE